MPLRRFEEALEAEGIPLGVSYPSLSDLELFRTANFAPTRRALAPATDYEHLLLPVAEHAASSTAWLEHRILLADRDRVLRVAEAARAHPRARGRDHGEDADRRRRVTARLALLGCGWVADMHVRAAAERGAASWASPTTGSNPPSASPPSTASRASRATGARSSRRRTWTPSSSARPNALHAEQSIAALAAGKHVLCEKPMATTSADAEAMLAAAARHDRLLLVLHPWRHHPAVIAVRDAIAAGELGRVVRTHGYGVHADWGPSGWFTDPALAGGGALVDMGIHAIDTARFLLGEPERSASPRRSRPAHGELRRRRRRRRPDRVGGRRTLGRRGGLVAAAPRRPRGRHRGLRQLGCRRVWAREQPSGYVRCEVEPVLAQVRALLAQLAAWQPGTQSPLHGLAALASASRPTRRRHTLQRMPADRPLASPASQAASPGSFNRGCCAPRSSRRPAHGDRVARDPRPPLYDADMDVEAGRRWCAHSRRPFSRPTASHAVRRSTAMKMPSAARMAALNSRTTSGPPSTSMSAS